MMALEAPRLRKEERFELDEAISLVRPNEMLTTGRILDLSLNGVGLTCDRAHAVVRVGELVRVFIAEVGFISGTVARHAEPFVAVEFDLPPSLERDLLIRKLFTVALPQIGIGATSWWEIWETLRSVWKMRSAMLEGIAATTTKPAGLSSEKLPAQSLVISPRRNAASLTEIANKRQMAA